VLGVLISMHASVSQRSREVGVLRALGFGRSQILFSFVVESAALGFGGALVGAAVSLLMPLVDFRCMYFATGQEVAFGFAPSLTSLGLAILAGTGVGAIGGLVPAIRAARVNPVQAMRARAMPCEMRSRHHVVSPAKQLAAPVFGAGCGAAAAHWRSPIRS
jgi:putative ABC transport system permease protein